MVANCAVFTTPHASLVSGFERRGYSELILLKETGASHTPTSSSTTSRTTPRKASISTTSAS